MSLQRLLPFGLSLKLAFTAALTVLGGAGFLGYVSDYATYWYAINIGIRAPLEGVPYLKAAVTLGSLFLMLTCAVIFAFSVAVIRAVYEQISFLALTIHAGSRSLPIGKLKEAADLKSNLEALRSSPKWLRFAFVFFAGLCMVGFMKLVFVISPNAELESNYALAGAMGYGVITATVLVMPVAIWPISFIFTSGYFVICIYMLFQPDYYARFLQIVGYGGSLPISLQSKNEILRGRLQGASTRLVLRTNNTFVIFDENREIYLEVPQDEVVYVSYGPGGFNRHEAKITPKVSQNAR